MSEKTFPTVFAGAASATVAVSIAVTMPVITGRVIWRWGRLYGIRLLYS
ncbi:hypothetical protein [Candidatus Formimonas warabiya]|nr:hypothetical protein [Candidatus Formimonas warabiya]